MSACRRFTWKPPWGRDESRVQNWPLLKDLEELEGTAVRWQKGIKLFSFVLLLTYPFLRKNMGGEAETERKHGIYLCKHDLLCFSNAIWHGGGQWSLPLMHQSDSGAEKIASIMVSARYFNNVWKLARKLQHSLEKKRGAGQNKWIKWRNNEENKHGTCFKDRGN